MQYTTLLLALSLLGQPGFSQKKASSSTQTKDRIEYICPMYCTDEVSSKPAECPVCGMPMEDRTIVENPKGYKIIHPDKAMKMMTAKGGLVLLDVRSVGEYNDELGHLRNSILIPIKELEGRVDELEEHKDKTIITYCSHGVRSARAAKLLTQKGYKVYSLIGGLTKWNRDGLPVVRE